MKIFNLRIVKNEKYEDLQTAWEKQNKEIDLKSREITSKQKRIDALEAIVSMNESKISDLTKQNSNMVEAVANSRKALEEKNAEIERIETSRNSCASQVGGYAKENHKLKDKINQLEAENRQLTEKIQQLEENKTQLEKSNDFLKNHRRAPYIEEIKDYTQKRKRRNRKLKG